MFECCVSTTSMMLKLKRSRNRYLFGCWSKIQQSEKKKDDVIVIVQDMDMEGISTSLLSAQLVVCTMWKVLGIASALLAEECIWLLSETRFLPVDVFPACQINKRLSLPLFRREDSNAPEDDAGKHEDVTKDDYSDRDNNAEDQLHDEEEEGGDDSAWESEDDVDSDSDGGGDDEDEDEDEGEDEDEDEEEDDNEDSDMEDYYDDEDSDKDEEESEYDTSGSEETVNYDDYPQLKHARRVYSLDRYCLFEHEHRKSWALDVDVESEESDARGLVIRYGVKKIRDFYRHYTVTAVPCDGIVDCSCMYSVSSGILCCHAQKVLRCLHIDEIPDRYILEKDKIMSTGSAEGTCFLKENKEDDHQSSPICTAINSRSAGSSTDMVSGSPSNKEITTDDVDPPLLRHARDIYSSDIFNMFKGKYMKSEYLIARDVGVFNKGVFTVEYEVEKPRSYSEKHKVLAVPDDGKVDCKCKEFEKSGLLCCHAIVVLDHLCIVKIPAKYILEKFKKDETVCSVEGIHGPEYPKIIAFLQFRLLYSCFEKLERFGSTSGELARILEQSLSEFRDRFPGMPKLEPGEVHGNSVLASGEGTSVTAREQTTGEDRDLDDDLKVDRLGTLGDSGKVLASGEGTSVTAREQTRGEDMDPDDDLKVDRHETLVDSGKADESTNISGAPSC